MTDKIKFSIDGKEYLAEPSESIWDVAKKNNIDIPHLCYSLSQVIELTVIVEHVWSKLKVKEL